MAQEKCAASAQFGTILIILSHAMGKSLFQIASDG